MRTSAPANVWRGDPSTAWHDDPELKTSTLAALQADIAADRLIRGAYLRHDTDVMYRGCMVGCLVASRETARATAGGHDVRDALADLDAHYATNWHTEVERAYGVPYVLARLWDDVFEKVPHRAAPAFAIGSVEAVPVGADLSLVPAALLADVLGDPEYGLLAQPWDRAGDVGERARQRTAAVLDLYRRLLAGDPPTEQQWREPIADRDSWHSDEYHATFGAIYAVDAAVCPDAYATPAVNAAVYADAYATAENVIEVLNNGNQKYAWNAKLQATEDEVHPYSAASDRYAAWLAERILHHTRAARSLEVTP